SRTRFQRMADRGHRPRLAGDRARAPSSLHPAHQGIQMTPKQIQIVQDSFQKVAPIADVAAELFYARLFELDPSLRGLFKTDMKRQGMTLMTMLGSAVRSLTNPQGLGPVLRSLGRRHVSYGVTDKHYDVVGQAFLDTLAHAFGPDF